MTEAKTMPEPHSELVPGVIAEKLKELEGRVKAAAAFVAKIKGEKGLLERRVRELEAALASRAEQVKAHESKRKKEERELVRMQEEREEVRLKVDRLLEEIAKIEASVAPKP